MSLETDLSVQRRKGNQDTRKENVLVPFACILVPLADTLAYCIPSGNNLPALFALTSAPY